MYNFEFPVKPLEPLFLVDTRTEKDGGYTPHVKEFLVCHYIVLADHVLAVNEYGHRVNLLMLGKSVFSSRQDAVNRLNEVLNKSNPGFLGGTE